MTPDERSLVGFTCAYTPLPLIDAAGLVPFRILPMGAAPDRAGGVLHDNICPHVKRVLDRALAGDLPELAGVVLMNSCDAMRRLADAWQTAGPGDEVILVDLPVDGSQNAAAYFAGELDRLANRLAAWSGREVTTDAVTRSVERYNNLAAGLDRLAERAARDALPGGRRALQEMANRSVTEPAAECLVALKRLAEAPDPPQGRDSRVPVLLFGNVLPDPEAFDLFEACGCRIVADDVCTGARQMAPIQLDGGEDVMRTLARWILSRPPCARTLETDQPGLLARHVLKRAEECGARGVIAHVMKFCDPYLARLPAVREALRQADLPLLVLEGDCTLRSLGQHRTRIEAFAEMLGG